MKDTGMKRSDRLASTMERQKTSARAATLPSWTWDLRGAKGVMPRRATVKAMMEQTLMWHSVSRMGNLQEAGPVQGLGPGPRAEPKPSLHRDGEPAGDRPSLGFRARV